MTADVAVLLSDAPDVAGRSVRAGPAALIRDVILGGQDGRVNVLGLVLGMAVATGDARVVVTAGLAALLAESIAMAGVAYTASGAERQLGDVARIRFRLERESQAAARAAMRRVRLAAAGLSPEARALVEEEAAEEAAAWAEQLERERDALSPVREHRPVRVAAVVGISTALGSAVPLLPFVLLPVMTAVPVALGASALVLVVAGVQRAALAGGSYRRAAFEMLAIGLVSAFAGYLIGQLLRVPGA
ncbi:MAG: hypothetical protein FIA92_08055 [Chloroflexi bacterium]|nr:hypothetical protein [Chloroflexota bacterium]